MAPKSNYDLVGLYITDDFIDVVCGVDVRTTGTGTSQAPNIDIPSGRDRFFFNEGIEPAFRQVAAWIFTHARHVKTIGIGCYGPFTSLNHDLRRDDPGYGLLQPSKRGLLCGSNVRTLLMDALDVRMAPDIIVETDVNVAALGHLYTLPPTKGRPAASWSDEVVVFLKISHGIGGGVVFGSKIWAGQLHPEMGHIQVRAWDGDRRWRPAVPSTCAHHAGCLQGVANIAALEKRWSLPFDTLLQHPDHDAWRREAYFLAQLCVSVTALLAPSRIIIGGRMMKMTMLVDLIRHEFRSMLADQDGRFHPTYPSIEQPDYIQTVGIDPDGQPRRPGVIGALCLAALMSRHDARVSALLPRTYH